MYITGYFYEPTTKVLYLFRNNEQEHFDTKPDVESEQKAIEIVNDMNNPAPVAPAPTPAPAPAPVPRPTPIAPFVEETFTQEESPNDLPEFDPNETQPEVTREDERRHQLSSLGLEFNPERALWIGHGFEVSEVIIRQHLPEYWNKLIEAIQLEVSKPTVAPGDEHLLSPVDANINTDGSPAEEIQTEMQPEEINVVAEEPISENSEEKTIEEEIENPEEKTNQEPATITKKEEPKKEEPVTYDKVSTDIKKIDAVTNFFSICAQYLVEFKMDMTIDNLGNLVCVLTPKINCKDKAFEKLPPISISGSAEELDANFFSAVLQPVLKAQAFATNANSYIDALEKAQAKTKAAEAEAKKAEKGTGTVKKTRSTKAAADKVETPTPAPTNQGSLL